MTAVIELEVHVSAGIGRVSALYRCPHEAFCVLLLAHGAGADMHHRFMEQISVFLADRGIATFRYQFPYSHAGKRRPDRQTTLVQTVCAAKRAAASAAATLPMFAGGKSMGGRMSSAAVAEFPDEFKGIKGLVFLGFPLHPANKPGIERASHLQNVPVPLLFLQGTRDKLAAMEHMSPVVDTLGPRATMHKIDGADHGFHVLKRSGRSDEQVMNELADRAASWMKHHSR